MLHRVRKAWFAALALCLLAASFATAENNPAQKPEAKNTPDAPADSTTEGSLKIGGQALEYRAISGTLTVGSTDPQDAMIGFDGKYLADATIDLTAKAEDRPATARIFYAAYLQKNPAKNRPITFLYTEVLAAQRCICTWARSAPCAWCCRRIWPTRKARPTRSFLMNTVCST